MITLHYYTYSQGGALMRALNAIATFFGTATFGSMLSIAIMVGAVLTLGLFTFSRNPQHLWKWAIVFALVPLLLIQQKARMLVIDLTEPGSTYVVDNVPFVVALPTWAASTLMAGITESVEAIFTTSDEHRYGRTGMLFGSELFLLSRQADVKEVALRRRWYDFFHNCIIGDVEINDKYTWDELGETPDLFGFLDKHSMSPLRGVILSNGEFQTCREFYPDLRRDFEYAAKGDLNLLSTYLFGRHASVYSEQLNRALSNSYHSFIGISNSAVDVLRQNMAINAVRFSINTLDPTSNALNYAYTQNKMQQTSMWATLGMQAREFLPMLHTMMFFIFSCLGFFVIAAAMIPSMTKMVLLNYVRTFFYLATWPALFAILNGIMLWTLESRSLSTASLFNGLSLKNAIALDELHIRFAWMTGFLMMSIPVLVGKILQGGGRFVESMNYQLASMINSTNARVSASASTGNVDFGNLQMSNHAFNNMTANKLDDTVALRTGMASVQNPDGSMTNTYFNDGNRQTFHSQDTESKALWSTQVQSLLQTSIQDQYAQAISAQTQTSASLTDAFNKGHQIQNRWNDAWSSSQSYGEGHTLSTEGHIAQANSKMGAAIESVSKTLGWTEDQSSAYLMAASAGVEIGTPKMLGSSIGTGVKWSDENREAFSHMTAEQKQVMDQATHQYSDGATALQRAGFTLDAKDNRSAMEQYAHDFALNYQRTQGLVVSASESSAKVDSLSSLKSQMESDSASFSASAMSGFQRYLEGIFSGDPEELQRLMTARLPEEIKEVQGYYAKYLDSKDFQRNFGLAPPYNEMDDLAELHLAPELRSQPSLTPKQKAMAQSEAELAQSSIEEITTDMIRLYDSERLFSPDDHRNVRGNAAVWGGHLQSQADPESESSDDSQASPPSEHVRKVESHTTAPDMVQNEQQYEGYKQYVRRKDDTSEQE
ncbi:conjugal transfer protein TraG (plasmid) [Vibrio nigripulchritudo]|uniref:conjugal transfer protein TraG N-terminal domain-containing protein n=1 Tax=Vibrio nigripulchritudo TaxID=28173 RepID=UPI0024929EDC|nr:conjugal transfer protein TraG N-terminal domain-containing protein [Vibrio nigripulchritudo]BDU35234.1 conjugal transfer protein TraG [Vibrio nigripulchritudo]